MGTCSYIFLICASIDIIRTLLGNIKFICTSFRNRKKKLATGLLFLFFSRRVQINISMHVYYVYIEISSMHKAVKLHTKIQKYWTFLLNFLLGIYSRFSVQPVFISTRSWVLGDSIHLYVHL